VISNGSTAIIDYNRTHNQTLSCSYYCDSTMPCLIEIPFTGSGITIYGLQVPGISINFTVSLDGKVLPQQISFPPQSPSAGLPTTYNITLYNNQSLPLSDHDLIISVTSNMIFDYAYVNQTPPIPNSWASYPASVPSSSSTPTTSPTPHPSRFPVGAAAGGTVGGLVAVGAIVSALLRFRRKTPTPAEFGTQPIFTLFDSQPPPPDMAHVPASSPYSITPFHHPNASTDTPPSQHLDSSPSADYFTPTPAVDLGNNGHSSPWLQEKDPNIGSTLSSRADAPDDRNSHNQLTDEQALYVQNLYSLNVPAPVVALVVERMLQEGGRTGESSSGVRRGNTTTTMPPSYVDP